MQMNKQYFKKWSKLINTVIKKFWNVHRKHVKHWKLFCYMTNTEEILCNKGHFLILTINTTTLMCFSTKITHIKAIVG